jgi:CRP-like cAMP-binding protein
MLPSPMQKRIAKHPLAPPTHNGPILRAIPFLEPPNGPENRLLNNEQRAQLAAISTSLRLGPRTLVYREGSRAEWVFAVSLGFVKAYRDLPNGTKSVSSFLFPHDIFGLAESGRYVNSVETITRTTLFRFPLHDLLRLIRKDADLQFQFLVKVTHELRESHRRAQVIARHDAVGRLAVFLTLMRDRARGISRGELDIFLPMTKADIASFLALCPETVSRATAQLERLGILRFENRHHVKVLDPGQLARLASSAM